ncbi:MAG TPA: glycosyltransferase family 4 protein [Planctomycetaceae bacterium]|nr:glycosyltransferase family 4 protein [Planctomycetaceae bacterium]
MTTPMEIAYYTQCFAPEIGAPSARVRELSREWVASGERVQVVTCFPNHPIGRLYPGYQPAWYMHEVMDGIEVHRHRTYLTPNAGFLKRTLSQASFVPAALGISNRRLRKPDVMIGTSPSLFGAVAADISARRFRVPFVMEVRDLWPAAIAGLGVLKNGRVLRMLERIELGLYRRATEIVVVTEAFRRNLVERGVPEDKVHVVPNGADLDFWSADLARPEDLRRQLGLEGKFVVLYIGAHGMSQALHRMLDSAESLRDLPQVEFVFVGEGAEKARLIEEASNRRLPNIRFLPPVDKDAVRDYYAASDVCLVPLRDIPLFDAFLPSKMFEIMAMGRPMIGSLRGEAAELLRRADAGIVVEPEDSAGIAQAVRTLVANPRRGDWMGESGKRHVQQNYARAALASQYRDVLCKACAKSHRVPGSSMVSERRAA